MSRTLFQNSEERTADTCSLSLGPPGGQSLALLQDLFRHAYYADRQFEWEDWLDPNTDLISLFASDQQEQVVGALVLQLEERPRTLPLELPDRINCRGLAIADVPQAGSTVRTLLKQGCQFLSQQGKEGQMWLTSNLSWLRKGAELADFEEVDNIRYMHRAVRRSSRMAEAMQVRAVLDSEVRLVAERDVEAFDAPWHMGEKELRMWARQGTLQVLIDGLQLKGYTLITLPSELPPTVVPFGFIVRLAVWPEFQRQGLGTLLLESALDWLDGHGRQRVRLNVLASDERALSFYNRHGFRIMRRPHTVFRKDIATVRL